MKWVLRVGLGIFLALLLLFGVVWLRSVIPTTVHDRELRLARADIPQGSNAFDVLEAAGSRIWWPEDRSNQINDLGNNTNWDGGLAMTVLANNREALAGWDAAAKMPDLQVPEAPTAVALMPYLSVWKKLAVLDKVRENALFRSGRDKEAFDLIMSHIQLGRRMQNARGVLICYLVGVSVSGTGLRQMQHWVSKTQLNPRQLKDYVRRLDLEADEDGAAFANTIRAEYQCMIGTLDALRSGRMLNPDTAKSYPHPTRLLPVLNFSKTKELFAQACLALVKAAPQHFNEAKIPDLRSHRPHLVSVILSGNLLGQDWYYLLMPSVIPSLDKKVQADVQLQATRTILALRAYQLAHGRLPADLAALVPEFLNQVPVDDFDGQPLRYSPERKIVYSVGKNLKDDGGDYRGSDAPGPQRLLDIVYTFGF